MSADLVSFHSYAGWVRGVPVGSVIESRAYHVDELSKQRWDSMLANLSRVDIVMHNAKYDMHMIREGTTKGWPGINLSPAVFWDANS